MDYFDFECRKKRPFWKESLICMLYAVGIWGAVQGYMNYSAYAQIVAYKWGEIISEKEVVQSPSEMNEKLKIKNEKWGTESMPQKPIANSQQPTAHYDPVEQRNQFKSVLSSMEVYPADNRIYLPRIGKNVPLVQVENHKDWNKLENNIQAGLRQGVVVHPVSRRPGLPGNFFVTGHSSYFKWDDGKFKDVFALLHEVEVGDEVYVFWEGQKIVFEIQEEEIVTPLQVDVLDHPEKDSILTLMTCTPVGTNTNRLILVGKLKS